MAADDVEICNLALARIGGGEDTRTISALGTSGDKTSELCDLLFNPTRKEVLKRLQPQECCEYEDLGSESSDTPEMAEWLYVFDLPDDFLHLIRQTDEQYHKLNYDCEVKLGYLFTNTLSNDDGDSAYIEYVVDEDTVTVFSDETVKCITTKLAAELAPRIVGVEYGHKRRLELLDEFEKLVLPVAKGTNHAQQHDENSHIGRDSKYSILGDRGAYD